MLWEAALEMIEGSKKQIPNANITQVPAVGEKSGSK